MDWFWCGPFLVMDHANCPAKAQGRLESHMPMKKSTLGPGTIVPIRPAGPTAGTAVPSHPAGPTAGAAVTIRLAGPDHARAVHERAVLDSAGVLIGPVLV